MYYIKYTNMNMYDLLSFIFKLSSWLSNRFVVLKTGTDKKDY